MLVPPARSHLDAILIQDYARPPLHCHTPIMTPLCVMRLIGSSHRAGLHDVIVLNKRHPHCILASSIDDDQTYRVHGFFETGAVAWPPLPCIRRSWVCSGAPLAGVLNIITRDWQRERLASRADEVDWHVESESTPLANGRLWWPETAGRSKASAYARSAAKG
jgi:hypothetical protein